MSNEELARLFHDTYEKLAPLFDYETRADTREFDLDSRNGQLMIAVCAHIRAALATSPVPAVRAEVLDDKGILRLAERHGVVYQDGYGNWCSTKREDADLSPDLLEFSRALLAAPTMLNGLTESETLATASVIGLSSSGDWRKKSERKVINAALDLFGASGTAAFMLQIPNTTPPLYVASGEAGEIRGAVDAVSAPAQQAVCSACNGTGEAVTCCGNPVAGAEYMGSTEWVCCGNPDRDGCSQCAAPAPSVEAQADDMRERFEAYMSSNGTWAYAIERDSRGEYKLAQTASAWNVWQAALKEHGNG